MMVKVLQDTYNSSPLHSENLSRSDVLVQEAAPRKGPPKVTLVLEVSRHVSTDQHWQAGYCFVLKAVF